MRPVAWSSSYLFRWPFGISTVTSNCTRLVWPTASPTTGGGHFLGVGTIASSGSTIVTAKTGRFRRRIAFGVIFLVVVLVGGGIALTNALSGSAAKSPAATVAAATLPSLGPATPVLAALSGAAPAPDRSALTSALSPLLGGPALGSGVTACVLE